MKGRGWAWVLAGAMALGVPAVAAGKVEDGTTRDNQRGMAQNPGGRLHHRYRRGVKTAHGSSRLL